MADIIKFPNNDPSQEKNSSDIGIPIPPTGKSEFAKMRQEMAAAEKAKFTEEMHQDLMFQDDINECIKAIAAKANEPERVAFKLHLELENSRIDAESADDPFMDANQAEILKKYGKVEKAISRDIIVPADMTLYALHYAIQRLFGWQNSHLHRFSLSENDFDLVTAGRYDTYMDLCGVLFRFPQDEIGFEDDVYDGYYPLKSWMKKKYSRPYYIESVCDLYSVNQSMAYQLIQSYVEKTEKKGRKKPALNDRDFAPDSYLADIETKIFMGAPWNYLVENMVVNELFDIFTPDRKRMDVHDWKTGILLNQDRVNQMLVKIKDDKSYSKEERFNIMTTAVVESLPYFDTIYYNYDFGDDWIVKIKVVDFYTVLDDMDELYDFENDEDYDDVDASNDLEEDDDLFKNPYDYFNSEGILVEGELKELLKKVDFRGVPVCVASDGVNVLDDVHNVWGFADMLSVIHGKNKQEAKEMRAWAKSQGWTGRKSKPENML